MNEELRKELLERIAADEATRADLAADGSLYEGYHPRMEAVHKRNAERLQEIIDQYGWPGSSLAGEDGAEAAWRIAQHAISKPEFQRKVLGLLKKASAQREVPLWQVAKLEDRIRFFEGRPQIYGTQFDWDENGQLSPCPEIEDMENVNERRKNVGLIPLEEEIRLRRESQSGEQVPRDRRKRQREFEEWVRKVGWR